MILNIARMQYSNKVPADIWCPSSCDPRRCASRVLLQGSIVSIPHPDMMLDVAGMVNPKYITYILVIILVWRNNGTTLLSLLLLKYLSRRRLYLYDDDNGNIVPRGEIKPTPVSCRTSVLTFTVHILSDVTHAYLSNSSLPERSMQPTILISLEL